MNSHQGHIILLKPELDLLKYEPIDFVQSNLSHYNRLREILNFIQPKNYRGSGRRHFDSAPFWVDDKGTVHELKDEFHNEYQNIAAKKQLALFESVKSATEKDEDLIFFTLEEMIRVYELIENKADYEILEIIANEETTNEKTIGFDVGYIGGDFFSAIADTAIKPLWHPPDFDDMEDILPLLSKLNGNCLFDTFSDARQYRETYLSKTWGEKEMYEGQITIIQIRTT